MNWNSISFISRSIYLSNQLINSNYIQSSIGLDYKFLRSQASKHWA